MINKYSGFIQPWHIIVHWIVGQQSLYPFRNHCVAYAGSNGGSNDSLKGGGPSPREILVARCFSFKILRFDLETYHTFQHYEHSIPSNQKCWIETPVLMGPFQRLHMSSL